MKHSRVIYLLVLTPILIIATLTATAGKNSVANQRYQTPPVMLGTSGGNVNDISAMYCCSGTLGSLVTKGGAKYILSNNHVLARSGQATAGEDISQPGLVDTNCDQTASNIVADFSSAAKLGSNVDAALAKIQAGMVDTTGAILGVGVPSATWTAPAVGMAVAKSGRTTGLTCSTIQSVAVSVNVQYDTECGGGSTFIVPYTGQVLIGGRFSAGGDSGSLIVASASARPVGLLFAGSSNSTIANPIGDVTGALGVTFVGGADHAISACATGGKPHGVKGQSLAKAVIAKEKHVRDLMSDPAVLAVGVSEADDDSGDAVIVVYIEEGRAHRDIPDAIDGVPTRVVPTDKFRAWGWNEPQRNACKGR